MPTTVWQWYKKRYTCSAFSAFEQPQPSASAPTQNYKQQAHRQFDAVFKQRIENALRDFEIGFIGGWNVQPEPSPIPTTAAKEIISIKPSLFGVSIDLRELVRQLRQLMTARR